MANINVDINANVDGVQKGFSAVQTRVKQLEQSITRLNSIISNTSSQKQLSSALDALKNRMTEFNKINQLTQDKFRTLPSTINQATFTLNNFTRVVQDAPFGLRGMANNIDPLVESFTRLRSQTGSTSGALKGMVAALTGPAGILLAVSTVTSFLVAYGEQIFNPIGESAKKQKKDLEDFKQILDSISGTSTERSKVFEAGATTDITKVQALVDVIKSSTASDKQKAAALEQLKNINQSYFGDITLTTSGLATLTKRQQEFNAALRNRENIQGFGDDIKKISPELAKLNNDIAQQIAIITAWDAKLAEIRQRAPETFKVLGEPSSVKAAREQLKALQEEQKKFIAKQGEAQASLTQAVIGSTTLRTLDAPKKELDSLEEKQRKIISQAQQLSDALGATVTVRLEIGILDTFEEKLKKSLDYLNAIKSGNYKLIPYGFGALAEPDKLITEADIPENIKQKPETAAQTKERLRREAKDRARTILDPRLFLALYPEEDRKIPLDLSLNKDNLKKIRKDLQDVSKILEEDFRALANIFSDLLSPAFDAFFRSFEENRSGIDAFFQAFGEGIRKLVQEFIKLAAIAGLVSLFSGGKISFGSAFKLVSGLPGRANGGPVSGNSPYLVGERGPELFVPNESGTIIPNNKVRQFTNESSNDSNLLELFNLNNITARALGGIVNLGQQYLVGERGPELFVPSVSGSIIPNNIAGSFINGRSNNGGGLSILRGQDILLAYARTQRSQLRVNG